ncbi:hypothetical protein ACJIZ3_015334 [Penstemon smallii]|uniref:Bifunctional inhibitor/plant lipid transfer protein/seed storage helical domain-containing protein n=1 Tax=Penstemon smallii TaxID=265156 RepID=A0ABD3RQI4_9LAMI
MTLSSLSAFSLSSVFLCLITSAVSIDPLCSYIPDQNLKDCQDYYFGSPNPNDNCCTSAKSVLSAIYPGTICRCYKASPWKLHFKLDQDKTLALVTKCGLNNFALDAVCCILKVYVRTCLVNLMNKFYKLY